MEFSQPSIEEWGTSDWQDSMAGSPDILSQLACRY